MSDKHPVIIHSLERKIIGEMLHTLLLTDPDFYEELDGYDWAGSEFVSGIAEGADDGLPDEAGLWTAEFRVEGDHVYPYHQLVQVARVRADLDKYRTPDWMTEALVSSFPAIKGSVLCDPCCGDGRMAMTLAPRFDGLIASDIDAEDVQAARDWTRNRFVTRRIAQADLTSPDFITRQITDVRAMSDLMHRSGFPPGIWTIGDPRKGRPVRSTHSPTLTGWERGPSTGLGARSPWRPLTDKEAVLFAQGLPIEEVIAAKPKEPQVWAGQCPKCGACFEQESDSGPPFHKDGKSVGAFCSECRSRGFTWLGVVHFKDKLEDFTPKDENWFKQTPITPAAQNAQ